LRVRLVLPALSAINSWPQVGSGLVEKPRSIALVRAGDKELARSERTARRCRKTRARSQKNSFPFQQGEVISEIRMGTDPRNKPSGARKSSFMVGLLLLQLFLWLSR
jgi:hypothetical protein